MYETTDTCPTSWHQISRRPKSPRHAKDGGLQRQSSTQIRLNAWHFLDCHLYVLPRNPNTHNGCLHKRPLRSSLPRKDGNRAPPAALRGYSNRRNGGSVYKLHRNFWERMFRISYKVAQPVLPDSWALQLGRSVEDAIVQNKGPELRKALS